MNNNGHVPMLGGNQKAVRAGVSMFAALPLDMDENCSFEPESVVIQPNGAPLALAGRKNLVTATDLVAMVVAALRPVIAEEVRNALVDRAP